MGSEYQNISKFQLFSVWIYMNRKHQHKNLMHLNVKYQQWKYPINVICTTFSYVGFVGLK